LDRRSWRFGKEKPQNRCERVIAVSALFDWPQLYESVTYLRPWYLFIDAFSSQNLHPLSGDNIYILAAMSQSSLPFPNERRDFSLLTGAVDKPECAQCCSHSVCGSLWFCCNQILRALGNIISRGFLDN
jgi:hypothetical protein